MVSAIETSSRPVGTVSNNRAAVSFTIAPSCANTLVAAEPIRAGEAFTARNVTAKRPGTGLSLCAGMR